MGRPVFYICPLRTLRLAIFLIAEALEIPPYKLLQFDD